MKAIVCKAYGPPDSLRFEEVGDAPVPGSGQVLIRVVAAGVNFLDTLIIEGKYQVKPPTPFSPGAEIAGVIAAIGAGVSGFSIGDRVLAVTGHGGFAQYVAVDVLGRVLRLPDTMDFATAAGFGIAYGTSLYALRERGHLRPGETLLVLGAGGGVGITACEIGAVLGARVIAAASTAEKLASAVRAGASVTINYREESIKSRIKALTGGEGVDVLYDPVGGDLFDEAMRLVGWNGRIVVVGFASGRIPQLPANLLLLKGISAIGIRLGGFRDREPGAHQAMFEDLFRWHAEGKLHPRITVTAPLEQAARVLAAVAQRQVQGKAVLTVA